MLELDADNYFFLSVELEEEYGINNNDKGAYGYWN